MKILICGCDGQLGLAISEKIAQQKNIITKLMNKTKLDITNLDNVMNIIKNFQPDFIINAAAYTSVDKAEKESTLARKINVDGPKNLAIAASTYRSYLIHISSDYVFSGQANAPYIEDDKKLPKSVYGQTKLDGENILIRKCNESIIIRTSWVFSKRGNNFVKSMLRLFRLKDELEIVDDQIGGPTSADDIAKVILKIIHRCNSHKVWHSGIYHYSGYPYVSWYDFAKTILDQAIYEKIIDREPTLKKISSYNYSAIANRPLNSRLNCSKIKRFYNINQCDWKKHIKGLKEYIDEDN